MPAEPAVAGESTLEGGSYDVIRRRLLERAAELGKRCDALNSARQTLFGGRELALHAPDRVPTEPTWVPRDGATDAGQPWFGFHVASVHSIALPSATAHPSSPQAPR